MLRCKKGFTMVELAFVTVIFPIFFLSLYSVFDAANVIYRTNGVFSQLNQNAMQTLRYISREVGQTSPNATPSHLSITQGANNNSVVTFQIPVDCDNDGDVEAGEGASCTQNLNNNKYVEWGAYDEAGQTQNGRLGSWVRYSVVNGQLTRQVLDSGLGPIAGLQKVVANQVQSFAVTQNVKTLTMTMTLSGTDRVGQAGQPRTVQTTFASSTLLRNAVS